MVFLHNAVWLLILLGVMILIHELGHFWAARYFGVGVEVFSFGFGPRLFGFQRGETDYRMVIARLTSAASASITAAWDASPRWR